MRHIHNLLCKLWIAFLSRLRTKWGLEGFSLYLELTGEQRPDGLTMLNKPNGLFLNKRVNLKDQGGDKHQNSYYFSLSRILIPLKQALRILLVIAALISYSSIREQLLPCVWPCDPGIAYAYTCNQGTASKLCLPICCLNFCIYRCKMNLHRFTLEEKEKNFHNWYMRCRR